MAQKQLTSTIAASEGQKAWFASLRERVFETRAPYAIGQADMPFELGRTLLVDGQAEATAHFRSPA